LLGFFQRLETLPIAMAPALIAVSAVSSFLLACFLPVKRVYSDVPSLALVFWLLVANLIHLVNAIVWAGNVEVHSEIWCDISELHDPSEISGV
jgi:pheromone a factor receptor